VLTEEACGLSFLEELMRAEHEAEKHLEQKVAIMLSYEIGVEKGIQLLNSEIVHTVHDVNKHLRGLEHQQFMDNMNWSRKA
jgi:hypothetical protein